MRPSSAELLNARERLRSWERVVQHYRVSRHKVLEWREFHKLPIPRRAPNNKNGRAPTQRNAVKSFLLQHPGKTFVLSEVYRAVGCSDHTAFTALRELLSDGRVERVGKPRCSRWRVVEGETIGRKLRRAAGWPSLEKWTVARWLEQIVSDIQGEKTCTQNS